MRRPYLLPLVLLLPSACAQAAPPPLFSPNIPAYLQALNQSTDPQAQTIRQRIASGPADLARERRLAEKEGIVTRAGQPQQTLPPAGENAAVLYARLDALRKKQPSASYLTMPAETFSLRYTYTPAQLDAIRTAVQSRPDILTLLHQAVAKPQCVFPSDPAPPFAEYAGLREDARELKAESTLLAFDGKYAEAAANQELGFRLAANAASTPKEIGFLVGGAIDAITIRSLQDILANAGPDAALDSRVEADILALPPLSLHHALSGEPAWTAAEIAELRSGTPADLVQAFQLSGLQTVPPAAQFTPAEQKQVGLILDAAEADYLHQMRQIIPAADNPAARHTVFAAAEARVQSDTDDPIRTISDHLNPVASLAQFAGSGGSLEQQADRVQARRLVTAAGAAVLAAKARTGAFPVALPAPFADPFTGKSLGYRPEGADGFVVYSAGPSGDYDGGKPGDLPKAQIFFRYPAAPIPLPPDMLK